MVYPALRLLPGVPRRPQFTEPGAIHLWPKAAGDEVRRQGFAFGYVLRVPCGMDGTQLCA